MADSKKAVDMGELTQEPITVGPVMTKLFCLVVYATIYDLIIGLSFMKVMQAPLGFDKYVATFCHPDYGTRIPLLINYRHRTQSVVVKLESEETSSKADEKRMTRS